MKSNCPEKSRLDHEYDVATASFAEAVKDLHRRMAWSFGVSWTPELYDIAPSSFGVLGRRD
jgi:hypothetical protein